MKRILNYPGSKWRIAKWIVDNMPSHQSYLEPYFGSGAVFFNKQKSLVETINDLDGRIVNLFRIMRERPDELAFLIKNTPYARDEFENSLSVSSDSLEDARRMLVRCWFAIGGKTSSKSGFRKLVSPNGPYVVQDWAKMPMTISEAGSRLKEAQIENMDALALIEQSARPEVLIYADPPYLPSTRSSKHYEHEYIESDHRDMLEVLKSHPGPVILSGYDSDLYRDILHDWQVKKIQVTALQGAKRQEVLFINPAATGNGQLNLFEEVE